MLENISKDKGELNSEGTTRSVLSRSIKSDEKVKNLSRSLPENRLGASIQDSLANLNVGSNSNSHTIKDKQTNKRPTSARSQSLSVLNPVIWPQWRDSNKNADIVFTDEVFHDLDLSKLDFSGVQFIRCRFEHCIFHAANFISSDLSHSEFVACDFRNAKLIASILNDTSFRKCELEEVSFLTSQFNNTVIVATDLSHIDLQSIDLKGITLDGCDLRNQNLSRKDLSYASLKRVDLRGANLKGAIFSFSDLSNSLISNCLLKGSQFKNANLQNINFTNLDVSNVLFNGANLTGCNFSGANLSGAQLVKANITDTTLFNINSIGWNISGVRCDWAFWDQGGDSKTNYSPNEFEKLYAESLSIELKYPNRISAMEFATLPILIEHLQASHWGVSLRIKSIQDVAGGALVRLVVDDVGSFPINELESSLKDESSRLQNAQLVMRRDKEMQKGLRESVSAIKEKFWPRLLELAAEHEMDQVRNFSVLFIDLKGFTQWSDVVLSEKLSLFRGLLKPILAKWNASYPNMEGDSLRATFRSAKAAIECAWMIHDVLMAAQFELRIGIDLGQVTIVHNEVTEQSDLEGNAVSMAARLESIAQPGEIIVSEKVKHYAEQQTDRFQFIPQQSQLKKSIGKRKAGDLIEVYRLSRENIE